MSTSWFSLRNRRCPTPWVWLLLLVLACQAQGQEPPRSLRQTLDEVLNQHPSLKAAQHRLAGSLAWARGAGALPNPQLRLSLPAGDPSEEANSLVQRLEIGGQPGLRSKIAELQAQQADARLAKLQRELGIQTAEAYHGLWSARETERLYKIRLDLAQKLHSAAERRLKAGEISQAEYLRAQLESDQAAAQFARARGQHKVALNHLNSLLQRPGEQELNMPLGTVDERPPIEPSREQLLLSIDSRPEVRVAELTAQIEHLEADLVARQRVPDMEFEAYRSNLGYRAEQGLRLSLVFPLWDWGQIGAASEKRYQEALAAESDLLALRQSTERELLAAWNQFMAEREQREALQRQSRGFQTQADLARRGYEAGVLSLLEVLEAQRAYREAMLEYVAAEAAFQKRRWEIYWLAGGTFARKSPEEQP